MEFIVYIALVLLGACLGSFAGATVWRLRARQLVEDKQAKEPVDAKEYKRLLPLTKSKLTSDRSHCLHCGTVLRWYDLIPIVSWLALRGKCRACRKPIGKFELFIELGVAAFFVLSYIFWPFALESGLDVARFVVWLGAGVILAILFAYDAKWFLLPDKLTIALGVAGAATAVIALLQSADVAGTLISIAGALVILSGLYLALYLISQGKWIGFGDVKLGIGLALLLSDWQLALLALFAANLIGCVIVIPALARGKLKRNSHVPFGPLLIAGMVVAQFVGPWLVDLYLATLI